MFGSRIFPKQLSAGTVAHPRLQHPTPNARRGLQSAGRTQLSSGGSTQPREAERPASGAQEGTVFGSKELEGVRIAAATVGYAARQALRTR